MEKIMIIIEIIILSLVDTSFVKHEIAVNYHYVFKASILSQCDFFCPSILATVLTSFNTTEILSKVVFFFFLKRKFFRGRKKNNKKYRTN